jgi:D-beta-D-heptose 7-phosphate kinase/D-beta-D-heptose 1-phosphate adenosyltransferase
MPNSDLIHRLSDLSRTRVLVVGDLILDHYVRGVTERTSPEAPVPVVLFREDESIPGGAANVARNVRAGAAEVECVGAVGADEEGRRLILGLEEAGVDCTAVVVIDGRPTTTKTRIISQNQQMLRLDRETAVALDEAARSAIIEACRRRIPQCNAVIVSDYAKGVLSQPVLEAVISAANLAGVPLFVDPKGRDFSRYRGAYALTPNMREASEASGESAGDLARVAASIFASTDCKLLVITRGADGLSLFREPDSPVLIPTAAREVFDVTGAGDTFVAYLAMAMGAGMDAESAARIANAAAGVVVGKAGAATVTPAELRAVLAPDSASRKLCLPGELEELGARLRAAGRKVVFTNGCFDFIHAGHVAMLQQARTLGDVLVLATNTDDVIARLKGPPRPVIRQRQREQLLAAIEAVDYVVPFPEETPHALLRALRPDFLVKGRNYAREEVEGWQVVEEYGGRVVLLDVIEDLSTRDLVARKGKAGA